MVIKRANTLILDFKNVRKKPSNIALHKWIKDTFKFTIDQVMCIQYDHIRYKVYVKLVSDLLLKKVLETYENGFVGYKDEEENEYEIYLSEDCDEISAKIFDLPLELSNQKLREVLSKYGTVKDIRNEKWTGEDMYNVESGVRLVNIIMKSRIPSYITVDGMTSLVTYRNQIRTCMLCEDPGHERRDCPKKPKKNRISQRRRPNAPFAPQVSTLNDNTTYANIIGNKSEISKHVETNDSSNIVKMDSIESISYRQNENGNQETIIEEPYNIETQEGIIKTTQNQGDKGKSTTKQRNKRPRQHKTTASSSEEERKVPKITIKMKDGTTLMETDQPEPTADASTNSGIDQLAKVNSDGEFY